MAEKKRCLVIGAGRMAAGIIFDLLNQKDIAKIHVLDSSKSALAKMEKLFGNETIKYHEGGIADRHQVFSLMREVKGVISAAPYEYNYVLTKLAIEAHCHFVDLGGNNKVVSEQFTLNAKAKRAGVGIIPDCGLAPGMVSVLAANAVEKFETVNSLAIRVGGLPLKPKTPLNYLLLFSVHGLINEYIEPSVILHQGKIKKVPSLSGLEEVNFPSPFNKLESFYTSGGISTLPKTFENKIKNLDYKTIRYPGHCLLFKKMLDLGFASTKEIIFNGCSTNNREIFEKLLQNALTYDSEDVTLILLRICGQIEGVERQLEYRTIQYGDVQNNLTAMMRTTAFPAAITLKMLLENRISNRGVLCQESSIPSQIYMHELEKRGIKFDVLDTMEKE